MFTSILICFFRSDPSGSLKTGITSLFGLSNIALFWKSKDYFATPQQLNPFTQTWSLGVEMQFYIIFPLITWFTGFSCHKNKGIKNLLFFILFLSISSLIAFIYFYSNNQPAAYFLMPMRFWEIATGCISYLSLKKEGFLSKKLESISPSLVLALIVVIMFLPLSFAVISTILTVFFTALLIFCLNEGKAEFKLFTKKSIVHLGLISYPLYLWHWGIIAISHWTLGINWWSIPFQIGLIYLLSVFSYKFIETPLRQEDWNLGFSKTIFRGTLVLIISTSALMSLEKTFSKRLYLGNFNLDKNLEDYRFDYDKQFCRNENKKLSEKNGFIVSMKCFGELENESKTLFFIGDSHNLSLSMGAEFVAKKTNSVLSYLRIPIFPEKRDKVINTSTYKEIISATKSGDIVFFTIRQTARFLPNWYEIDEKGKRRVEFKKWLAFLEEFALDLSKKNTSLVISTPTPEFANALTRKCEGQNQQWFSKFNQQDCSIPLKFFIGENGKFSHLIQKIQEVESKYNNLYVFNALEVMCPNQMCIYSLNNKLLYRDDDHISNYAARFIFGQEIIKFLKQEKLL